VQEEVDVAVRCVGTPVQLGGPSPGGPEHCRARRPGPLPGAVGRVSVHDEDLEGGCLRLQGIQRGAEDGLFVEGRNDDRNEGLFGHATGAAP
jgi:hypothetical protein